jgi:hypothetical protein
MKTRRFVGRLSAIVPATAVPTCLAAAVLILVGLGMSGCSEPGPGSAKSSDELLAQLSTDRQKIDQASDTMMKRIEAFNASRGPGEQKLQFSEVFAQDLTGEQKDILNKMAAEEQDISYQALLQQIITDRDSIQDLQEHIARLEQTLSDQFVLAKRGDRHQELAMAYLTNDAHLDAAKAKELLKQVDQTDELLPGNKVWFFYDPQRDSFRTYVTQGEAGQTPLVVRRARQRKLIEERDTFKAERDSARVEVATLNEVKTNLEADLARRANSVFYHADAEQALKDQGVLSPVLKKVKDVAGVQYDESLDLREGTTITLLPEHYGLTKIRDVRMLPSIYQEGRDFTVEASEDGTSARIVILTPDAFRGKEILLAVRG